MYQIQKKKKKTLRRSSKNAEKYVDWLILSEEFLISGMSNKRNKYRSNQLFYILQKKWMIEMEGGKKRTFEIRVRKVKPIKRFN